ncbi:MAG: hypothetical protein WC505_05950 [Patescibacteria group bacterium]
MPRYIVKLPYQGQDYYLEWSTIVDAPVTYGMLLEEFQQYYRDEYGANGQYDLPGRLARVDATGTSSRVGTLAELLASNRAGPDEASLTQEEIIQKFIAERPEEQ